MIIGWKSDRSRFDWIGSNRIGISRNERCRSLI